MEGRCAISDLSDPIRPQKVSEMFNELYDNQWTEAFEWLVSQAKTADDRSDRVVTKQLLDILMVYDIIYYTTCTCICIELSSITLNEFINCILFHAFLFCKKKKQTNETYSFRICKSW